MSGFKSLVRSRPTATEAMFKMGYRRSGLRKGYDLCTQLAERSRYGESVERSKKSRAPCWEGKLKLQWSGGSRGRDAPSPHVALCWFWLALPASIFIARATASSSTSTDKMAEYWKSTASVAHGMYGLRLTKFQPKYWCKYCEIFVKDTKFEKQQHEATGRHQGNIRRSLKGLHREQEIEARKQAQALRDSMASSQEPAAQVRQPLQALAIRRHSQRRSLRNGPQLKTERGNGSN
jgi:hypothetical protein